MPVAYVEDGLLKVGGHAIREFGVNTPDLLIRWLNGPGSVSPRAPLVLTPTQQRDHLLRVLADNGIRFVRFAPFGNRPLTLRTAYLENRESFLGAFDSLVRSAETLKMALIPSLFFSATQIPPLFGENLPALADPQSRSYELVADITTTIVSRYKGSSAIGYWEYGNEMDGFLGIPSPKFSTAPDMGTPAAWTDDDGLPLEICHKLTKTFLDNVRVIDSEPAYRNSPPRATASGWVGWRFKLSDRRDWNSSVEERFYDDATDTLTIHPYEGLGWHDRNYTGLMIYLSMLQSKAKLRRKPLIVGEFGVSTKYQGPHSNSDELFLSVLQQVARSHVQLALLWAVHVANSTDPDWNFGPHSRNQARWHMFLNAVRNIDVL